jgi:hypothetical protein
VTWSFEIRSCGAICAAEAQVASWSNEIGPKTAPSWCFRKNQLWPETSSISRSFAGRRRRGDRRRRDLQGLPGHQLQRVVDVIELLQIADAHAVHFCDRGKGFSARDDVTVAATSGRRCCRRRCRCCGRGRWRCRACGRIANHDARTLMTHFQLKLQDLLRQHVDLRVLFVDFFGQLLKLGGLARGRVRTWGKRLRETSRPGKTQQSERAPNPCGHRFHGTFILASGALPGKPGRTSACLCTNSP